MRARRRSQYSYAVRHTRTFLAVCFLVVRFFAARRVRFTLTRFTLRFVRALGLLLLGLLLLATPVPLLLLLGLLLPDALVTRFVLRLVGFGGT